VSQDGVQIAWLHKCPREGTHLVGVGEPRNWCGAVEAQESVATPAQIERMERSLKDAFGHGQ
jgi:hypothetical protein